MKLVRLFIVATMLLSFGMSVTSYAMPADEKPATGEKKQAKKKVEKKPQTSKGAEATRK
ncbi:MAG TPA: hypothetical protein VD837_00345 [Terriglobales bacterium]|nr:hypothetical protein [Terriglobales bacterium]